MDENKILREVFGNPMPRSEINELKEEVFISLVSIGNNPVICAECKRKIVKELCYARIDLKIYVCKNCTSNSKHLIQ